MDKKTFQLDKDLNQMLDEMQREAWEAGRQKRDSSENSESTNTADTVIDSDN